MSLFILSYVPVTRPSRATTMIKQFLVSTNPLGPFDVPHAKTNSITGGKINAKPDEQSAPINEMNAFRAGTSSAKESGITKRKSFEYQSLSIYKINCGGHLHVTRTKNVLKMSCE